MVKSESVVRGLDRTHWGALHGSEITVLLLGLTGQSQYQF